MTPKEQDMQRARDIATLIRRKPEEGHKAFVASSMYVRLLVDRLVARDWKKPGMPKLHQAKDIPTLKILQVVRALQEKEPDALPGQPSYEKWTFTWDIFQCFKGIPERVIAAKLASLVRRKILHGCTCGCRGDFYFTVGGFEYFKSISSF